MSTTPKTPRPGTDTADENVETANKSYIKGETVPAQVSSNPVEVVEVEPTLKQRVVNRVKGLVHNKRVVASATSVAVIAAGVLVVRHRNAAVEDSTENTEG